MQRESANLIYLDFGALFHVSILRYRISDNYRLETGVVDAWYGRAREDSVC